MSRRNLAILGAPTSAGAHAPGQEMAPVAFREAGLIDRLTAYGLPFEDMGDLPEQRWQARQSAWDGASVNNIDAVIASAEYVRDAVRRVLERDRVPIVLGGDCTITVGAVAGALAAGMHPGLIYVDGGWDLSSPAMYPAGILDSMGLGHMLDLPGSTHLAEIAPVRPMLTPERVVQFGHGAGATDGPEERLAAERKFLHVPGADVRGRATDAAREALAMLPADLTQIWLHFDVDVIDFFDAPLADVPLHGNGLPYADAIEAVRVFAGDPRCIGLTVTEFNPDHARGKSGLTEQFVDDLVRIAAAVSAPVPAAR